MPGDLAARLREARDFRPELHLPISLGGARLGWVRRDLAERLRDWPGLFTVAADGIAIRPAPEADLTEAFGEVTQTLSRDRVVRGWRGETYAVRGSQGVVPSFHIERAAVRFFGFTASAAHLNGFQGKKILISRRARTKAIDPGMLDNLVGGGIPSGQDAWQTLLRECGEEAGMAPELARKAERKAVLQVCRDVPDGVHSEILFVYDLELPPGFAPRNTDGEVAEFMTLEVPQLLERIAAGDMTVEARLVAAEFLLRRGLLPDEGGAIAAAVQACRPR